MAPARAPPKTGEELDALEDTLVLPRFTADEAWELGCMLRERLLNDYTRATIITILLPISAPPNSFPYHILFHSATRPGTSPDNMAWVTRKTATVLRWGRSSYNVGIRANGDEEGFARRFGMGGTEAAGRYAIHGGAVPVRVKGVEAPVAVAVVSGLKQEEDHMVVVEALEKLKKKLDGGS